jgi:tellurite resistance protein TerC
MKTLTVFWLVFAALFVVVFIIDMYTTNRRKEGLDVKTSLKWTALWISIALLFGAAIYLFFPNPPGSHVRIPSVMMWKFIAGYFTEYSLSIDNLFVFIMIFSLMAVPESVQPFHLKIGILLSIVLRIGFIIAGMTLVQHFSWIMYVFGAILLWTAYKMAFTDSEEQVDPEKNILYRAAARMFPVHRDMQAASFFKKINNKWHITPLFLVFLVIGSTNVLFAMDSIPAIIGIINEGSKGVISNADQNFLAITSNTFSVMGLVSLYFALKGVMKMFHLLQQGVSFILFFIAAKMLLCAIPEFEKFFAAHAWISPAVVVAALGISILLSILITGKQEVPGLEEVVETASASN